MVTRACFVIGREKVLFRTTMNEKGTATYTLIIMAQQALTFTIIGISSGCYAIQRRTARLNLWLAHPSNATFRSLAMLWFTEQLSPTRQTMLAQLLP
jgi:hypothetical protein